MAVRLAWVEVWSKHVVLALFTWITLQTNVASLQEDYTAAVLSMEHVNAWASDAVTVYVCFPPPSFLLLISPFIYFYVRVECNIIFQNRTYVKF